MRTRTIFIIALLVGLGPALLRSHEVAEAFGCQVDLNRIIPCVIGGKDYGQTFYDLGFLIWYSYLSLPAGLALFGVCALAALIAIFVSWRRQNRPPSAPLSPGKSFLRGALIVIALAFSPVAVAYTAGLIALLIRLRPQRSVRACLPLARRQYRPAALRDGARGLVRSFHRVGRAPGARGASHHFHRAHVKGAPRESGRDRREGLNPAHAEGPRHSLPRCKGRPRRQGRQLRQSARRRRSRRGGICL